MFDLSGAIEMDEVSPSKYIAAASLPEEAVYAYAPTACRAHDGKKGECCDAGCQYFELSRKGDGAGMCVEAAGRESEYFSTPVHAASPNLRAPPPLVRSAVPPLLCCARLLTPLHGANA